MSESVVDWVYESDIRVGIAVTAVLFLYLLIILTIVPTLGWSLLVLFLAVPATIGLAQGGARHKAKQASIARAGPEQKD